MSNRYPQVALPLMIMRLEAKRSTHCKYGVLRVIFDTVAVSIGGPTMSYISVAHTCDHLYKQGAPVVFCPWVMIWFVNGSPGIMIPIHFGSFKFSVHRSYSEKPMHLHIVN